MSGKSYTVTLIPGDGIGPELADAAVTVLAATGIDIEWQRVDEQHFAQQHAEGEANGSAHHTDDRALIQERAE